MSRDSVYFRASPNPPRMPDKTSAQDPLVSRTPAVCADNGRDRLIRARSVLGSTEDYPRFQRGVYLGG
jgi:hypothetical protein